jgi:hypothetical protein
MIYPQEERRREISIVPIFEAFDQKSQKKEERTKFEQNTKHKTLAFNQNKNKNNINFILKIIGYTGFYINICLILGVVLAMILNRPSFFVTGFFLGLSLISTIILTLANIDNIKLKKIMVDNGNASFR